MTARPMWSRRAVSIMSMLLVVVGLVAAWQTTSHARGAWWEHEPRQGVGPDEDGVATANGLGVAVEQVAVLESVEVWDEEATALEGHRFWHIALEFDVENSAVATCEVFVQDTKGRHYEVGRNTPSGVEGYTGYPRCQGDNDSGSDVDPLQAFIVTLPADAEPRYIRVQSQLHLAPQFLELPAG